MDFVLWKPSGPDLPGWDSPWGRGRPGWHIECSAMAHELLGDSFDIHGGGNDLMFPHHENEIAQSCCAHPEGGFAQVWMHNEMLQVEGKKMSKSLGNFFTVRDLLDQGVPGEVIRFVFLSTHYRKPMDWTEKKAKEAEATLQQWADTLAVRHDVLDWDGSTPNPHPDVTNALSEDLNSSLALTKLGVLFKYIDNREDFLALSDNAKRDAELTFVASAALLGLDVVGLARAVRDKPAVLDLDRFQLELAYERVQAMERKDFSKVDALKKSLTEAGVEVRMSKDSIELKEGPNFDPTKLEALK